MAGDLQPVEGKVVSTPSSRYGNNPRSQYILQGSETGSTGGNMGSPRMWAAHISAEPRRVSNTQGWPSFLGNRTILAASWLISMVAVSVDDWRNNGILPRPSRLWSVSLFYGLLALASLVDALVPLINVFAIGYTIMLLWNYFSKAGQFA